MSLIFTGASQRFFVPLEQERSIQQVFFQYQPLIFIYIMLSYSIAMLKNPMKPEEEPKAYAKS